ncbi:hypothetical protein SAMN04487949_1328 [Halogranum gelatinilyticum]|uniref:Sensor histidine kinase n=1 Tax=Halogranum gelatinilyticum TaxID=660521 RepID=A0A1G9RFW7_9EURY|nr:hypothetical protein [Halogranum gelatinilyticum]SDM22219.1 hypothetical protein SAMN04487949_1328 [Halogranum gelatinilyticum]
MRGPLRALWNSPLLGRYLRFRLALLIALPLAALGAAVAFTVGGLAGILLLSVLVFLGLVGLAVLVAVR